MIKYYLSVILLYIIISTSLFSMHETNNLKYTKAENITLLSSAMMGGLGIGLFANFTYLSEMQNPFVKYSLVTLQAAVGGFGNYLFSKILIDKKLKWSKAIVYGMAGGALIGGLVGIVNLESAVLIGRAAGEIVFDNSMSTWMIVRNAAMMGSVLGILYGVPLGLVEGPVISIVLRF